MLKPIKLKVQYTLFFRFYVFQNLCNMIDATCSTNLPVGIVVLHNKNHYIIGFLFAPTALR